MKITLGIENLEQNFKQLDSAVGNIALLAHAPSIDQNYIHSAETIKKLYGKRFKSLLGPQHGFICDVQDNMIESKDFIHPKFDVPVYSLYGETRIPTDKMLKNIDTIFVDLLDVGTRVYTYISTLYLLMEKCLKKDIKIIILDRPNPVGGNLVEGNVLELPYQSFVGMAEVPMRHGLTIAEMAKFYQRKYFQRSNLQIISMIDWKREYFFNDCQLPWINPSPNLSTPESAIIFCGSVLFEGTNISEGRGTTRALEQIGFPKIDPYKFIDFFNHKWNKHLNNSFLLRATNFLPTFQKHANIACGAIFIHSLDHSKFYSWRLGQILLQTWYEYLGDNFKWNQEPYEYKFKGNAIDYINGSDKPRKWIENGGSYQELLQLEQDNAFEHFLTLRREILVY